MTSKLMQLKEEETREIFSVLKVSHFSPSLINGTLLPVPIPLSTSRSLLKLCANLNPTGSEQMFTLSEWLKKPTQDPETLDLTLKEMREPLEV